VPMSYPDMASLERTAEMFKFRPPHEGESEHDFRNALADFVEVHPDSNVIGGMEIRTGKGWDQFTDAENLEMLLRGVSHK
jgi:hypothetical protein